MTIADLIAEPLRMGISPTGSPTSTDAGLTLSAVRNGRLDLSATKPIDLTHLERERYQVRGGAFYVVRGNGQLHLVGRGGLAPDVVSAQVAFPDLLIEVIPNRSLIDPAYLALVWNERVVRSDIEARARTSSGIHKINMANLRSVRLPVPPLAQQRRLIEQLEAELTAVSSTQEAVSTQSQRSEQLRVTVVRDLIPLPEAATFPIVPLSDCVEFLDHRRRPINQSERDQRVLGKSPVELYPYYGANGQAGWIDDYLFDEPLVLLAEDGGSFGSPTRPIAYRIDGRTWVNNHAHVLRPLAHMDVDYLHHALAIRPDIANVISGSTRGKLNREVAGVISVSVPPLPEQRRIAAALRERLAEIDAITAAIEAELEAIEALPAALLRRAFDDLAA